MTDLIAADNVGMTFPAADGGTMDVFADVSLTLHEGEVVAILGKSGCGKSTLLRLLAGLIAPTSGQVRYRGKPLKGANPGVAMVFQSFALLPWLTVQDNVELGLRAAGVPPKQRRIDALEAIDRIGLDGFETAYPRELSGGMRQRVGLARALVLKPDVLVMDEPFTALDVLTSENLRTELVSLFAEPDFPTSCILIVTHNIEEAVQLADRVVVMGTNPGGIRTEVEIGLPRPRDRKSAAFEAYVDRLYGALTGDDASAVASAREVTPLTRPLPDAGVGAMAGLVQLLAGLGGRADLADIADELTFEVDDLLPIVDAAGLLGLLTMRGGRAELTEAGRQWASSDIQRAKETFATLVVDRAPLVGAMVRALRGADGKVIRIDLFRNLLHRGFTSKECERQLDIAIDWGRYGELFDYDDDDEVLRLTAKP